MTGVITRRARSTLLGYALLAPSLFGVACFLLLPMLVVVWLSLHRWDLLGPIRYVGLDNWRSVLTDAGFGNSLLVTLIFIASLPAWLVFGQTPTPTGTPAVSEVDSIRARLAEVQAERASIDAGDGELPAGATASEAVQRRAILQETNTVLQQHVDVFRDTEALQKRKEDEQTRSNEWPGLASSPPYSILAVDGLRDAVQSLIQQVQSGEARLEVISKAVDDAESRRKRAESELRQANERLEGAGGAASDRNVWLRDLEKIRSRLAGVTLTSLAAQRRLTEEELAFDRQRLAQLQRQLAEVGRNVSFTRAELDRALAPLEVRTRALEKEMQSARLANDKRQQALQQAREATRVAREANLDAAALVKLEATLDIRREQAETSQLLVDLLNDMIGTINAERNIWEGRFALGPKATIADAQRAAQHLGPAIEQARAVRGYVAKQIEAVARKIADYESRIIPGSAGALDPPLGREAIATLIERESYLVRAQRAVDHLLWLVARAKGSLVDTGEAAPVRERVRGRLLEVPENLKKIWNFELFSADDTIEVDGQKITGSRSITVGKVAVALFILVFGYFACRILARLAQIFVIRRFGVEPNLANLVRRWVLFLTLCILVLTSLSWVKIPLTTFAFLGGALAIGVGFGTQNLLKNLISGIMLLIERPLRVGDVIELGNTRGRVNSIGIRSSVIGSADGIDTIVPNSALLENNVTNWTYSSAHVRFAIRVGVAYGSTTRDVGKLLTSAAAEHGKVLKEPAPQILFEDFGENALIFSLNYWLEVNATSDTKLIASDLRHMIDQRFREAGVVFAFPQRDLRLDTARPLQIEVVPTSKGKSDQPPATPDP
jgi:potassium efflux system protein